MVAPATVLFPKFLKFAGRFAIAWTPYYLAKYSLLIAAKSYGVPRVYRKVARIANAFYGKNAGEKATEERKHVLRMLRMGLRFPSRMTAALRDPNVSRFVNGGLFRRKSISAAPASSTGKQATSAPPTKSQLFHRELGFKENMNELAQEALRRTAKAAVEQTMKDRTQFNLRSWRKGIKISNIDWKKEFTWFAVSILGMAAFSFYWEGKHLEEDKADEEKDTTDNN